MDFRAFCADVKSLTCSSVLLRMCLGDLLQVQDRRKGGLHLPNEDDKNLWPHDVMLHPIHSSLDACGQVHLSLPTQYVMRSVQHGNSPAIAFRLCFVKGGSKIVMATRIQYRLKGMQHGYYHTALHGPILLGFSLGEASWHDS